MPPITVPCGRADIFATYANAADEQILLPVVGYDAKGKAIVQKPDGDTGRASSVQVGRRQYRLITVGAVR
jgi:hypothetical protein